MFNLEISTRFQCLLPMHAWDTNHLIPPLPLPLSTPKRSRFQAFSNLTRQQLIDRQIIKHGRLRDRVLIDVQSSESRTKLGNAKRVMCAMDVLKETFLTQNMLMLMEVVHHSFNPPLYSNRHQYHHVLNYSRSTDRPTLRPPDSWKMSEVSNKETRNLSFGQLLTITFYKKLKVLKLLSMAV